MKKNNSALFYTCSLIEYIGRIQKQKRSKTVQYLGKSAIKRIYQYADMFHSESIEGVADNFIVRYRIPADSYDNITKCRYEIPDYWTIGQVYERLIEDVTPDTDDIDTIADKIMEIFTSWISDAISNYNSDFYYQSRDYIAVCYKEGKICA